MQKIYIIFQDEDNDWALWKVHQHMDGVKATPSRTGTLSECVESVPPNYQPVLVPYE